LFEDGSTEEHYCSANCNTDKPTVNKCTTRSQEGCDAHGDGLNSSFITGELGREMYELDHGAEVTRTENAPYLITGEMVPNKVYTTATYYDTSNLEGGGKLDIDGDINGLQLDKSFSGSERSQDEWRGGFGEFLGSIGTTLPIMRLLFPDRTTDIFTSYDKWAHGLYGTEYFESLVCKGELTDQASEGLSQIKLQDGSIATTAHVTGQKRGPNALLCDLAAEEPCPNDGECDDGLCYLDKELMYAYEYIIEWAARSPADSALSPGINEANEPYVSFNVHIQCIENSYGCPEEVDGNGWYPLYTSDFGSEGVIMLTPGQQDSDKIVTYSVYNYDKVKFDWFIAPEGVSFNSGGDIFGVADSGFGDGGQARDIESSIVDLGSSPSTVNYQESEVSTVNSVSSSNSEITRSTI